MERQLVVFNLADAHYGVPIEQVQEIIRFTKVTGIPKAPKSMLGVINLRNRVIPVLNLRDRFGFPAKKADHASRIIVSNVQGSTVGLFVDSVTEVISIDEAAVEPAPPAAADWDAQFVEGICKVDGQLILALDLAAVVKVDMPNDVGRVCEQ